jgi:oligogalacturonide lyase
MMAVAGAISVFGAEQSEPTEWIEPATGHRVVRLSTEPGSSSYYFHQNAYTASGDKLLISTPDGLATVKLATRQIDLILPGRAAQVVVGRNSRQAYYTQSNVICSTDLDTHATRVIATLPGDFGRGSGLAVNADETLLAGSYVKDGSYTNLYPSPDESPGVKAVQPGSGGRLEARFEQHLPMGLFTINIKSGEINTFNASTDWENHVQFSPTDPTLLMFCHEGPWHKVDRIWTIRTDGTGLRKVHTRTMDMEIAGHEFFSADGKIIWYDLQTPKGKEFWLAGVVIATGEQIRYKVQRDQWSVHYNVSRDGKLFSGDGGGPNSVAAPGNGQWLYLFHPENGELKGERLVDLSKHDYNLEPNGTFTPDGKWIVFRSNMHGATQVYAVEVAKSADAKSLN